MKVKELIALLESVHRDDEVAVAGTTGPECHIVDKQISEGEGKVVLIIMTGDDNDVVITEVL